MKKIINAVLKYWKAVPVCVLMALMAYYSWQFAFYTFPEDASGYAMETVVSGDGELGMYFAYDGYDLSLVVSGGIDESDIQYYGMANDGIAIMGEEHVAQLTDEYTGNFMAVSRLQYGDYNGDGLRDRLHYAARTDMEFSQSNTGEACPFGSEVFALEVLFNYREQVQIYYNGEILAGGEVTVTDADGNTRTYITGENGVIEGLSARDAWKGFTVSYTEDEYDFYILSYCVEENTVFTLRHLQAMAPLLVILGISAAGILACLLVRHFMERQAYGPEYAARKRGGTGRVPQSFSLFMLIRWCAMLLTWALVFYGAHIFGKWFDQVTFPILACGLENENQFISGSCYYLANLDLLFNKTLGEIIAFFATLAASIVLLGRIICGFLCPMGLAQDLIHQLRQRLHIEGIAFNEKMYGYIQPIKWMFLVLMIGLCFAGGKFCDFCPAKTLSPAFAGFKVSLYASGFVMVAVVIGSFFKRRIWCTVCPLGFILGLFHRISLFQLKKECRACTACGACYEACPMGIKDIYTEREKANITSDDCIMCGECVRCCPENNALSITFCGKRVYTSSRENVIGRYGKKHRIRKMRSVHDKN